MDRYVEGSTRAKVWYFSVCAAVALALVLVNVLFPFPQKPWTQVSQIHAAAQRYLVGALLFAALFIPWSFRVVALARLSIKHGSWPPPGIPMPFRTRIVSVARSMAGTSCLRPRSHLCMPPNSAAHPEPLKQRSLRRPSSRRESSPDFVDTGL